MGVTVQEQGRVSAEAGRRAVTKAAALSAIGGVLFGYDTGVIGGVLPNIAHRFGLTSAFGKDAVVSVLLVGAALGALVAGRLADRLGRKRLVLVTSVVFVVGIVLSATAPALWVLLLGRLVIGLGVGSASFGVPLYIGELAPPERRGGLVSYNQLSVTLGILVSEVIAYVLAQHGDWRISVSLAVVPAVALGLGVLREPESPAWLVRQGRVDEAREVLRRLRGSDADIDGEVEDVRSVADEESRGGLRDLLSGRVRPALVVGVVLAVIQQITGINTVIYFAPTVLQQAGLGSGASLLANVVVGTTNVLLTIAAVLLLDRVGRRPLLLVGTAGMVLGLGALGALFVGGLGSGQAVLATVALCVYVGSFAIGLGPVFWLLIGELYPLRVRGQAASVATMANWLSNLVLAASYLSIIAAVGNSATFFALGGITLVSLAWIAKNVPETRGRSLQAIERDLQGGGAVRTAGAPPAVRPA